MNVKKYEKKVEAHLGAGTLLSTLPTSTVYEVEGKFHGTVKELCEKIAEQETQP